MKKKLAILLSTTLLSAASVAVLALNLNNNNNITSKAEGEQPYTLTINTPLFTGSGTSGEGYTYVQTQNGNNIKIKYFELSPLAEGINVLRRNSYIEIVSNNDILGLAGITSVSLNYDLPQESVRFKVSYGWNEGVMMNTIEKWAAISEHNTSFAIENSPSYLKIHSDIIGNDYLINLKEIVISYSCQTSTDPYFDGTYVYNFEEDHFEVARYRGTSGSLDIPGEYNGYPVTAIADDFSVDIGKEDITDVTLPDSVTRIGKNAFNGAENMTTINLDKVTDYDYRAFFNCKKLFRNVSLKLNATHIGESAFSQSGVTIIDFYSPINALQIDRDAFSNADNLMRVYFNPRELVLTIGSTVFRSCDELYVIYLPESINSYNKTNYLETSTFNGCTALGYFYYRGTADQWKSIEKSDLWHKDIPATYVTCFAGEKVDF